MVAYKRRKLTYKAKACGTRKKFKLDPRPKRTPRRVTARNVRAIVRREVNENALDKKRIGVTATSLTAKRAFTTNQIGANIGQGTGASQRIGDRATLTGYTIQFSCCRRERETMLLTLSMNLNLFFYLIFLEVQWSSCSIQYSNN